MKSTPNLPASSRMKNPTGGGPQIKNALKSKALNDATPGSSPTSQHCTGEALDLDQDDMNTGVTNKMVFDTMFLACDTGPDSRPLM